MTARDNAFRTRIHDEVIVESVANTGILATKRTLQLLPTCLVERE